MVVRPVTQTAEVDVNKWSKKLVPSTLLLMDKLNKKAPMRITDAKLNAICCAGVRFVRIFLRILFNVIRFEAHRHCHFCDLS